MQDSTIQMLDENWNKLKPDIQSVRCSLSTKVEITDVAMASFNEKSRINLGN